MSTLQRREMVDRARQAAAFRRARADTAQRLLRAYLQQHEPIVAAIGAERYDEIVGAHLRWVEWLASGRARKLAMVVERV